MLSLRGYRCYSLKLSGDPVAQWLATRIGDREVSGSNPASHSEKCHRGAMARGPVLANFISSTEMRHPPALPLPSLKFGYGQYFYFHFLKNCLCVVSLFAHHSLKCLVAFFPFLPRFYPVTNSLTLAISKSCNVWPASSHESHELGGALSVLGNEGLSNCTC